MCKNRILETNTGHSFPIDFSNFNKVCGSNYTYVAWGSLGVIFGYFGFNYYRSQGVCFVKTFSGDLEIISAL